MNPRTIDLPCTAEQRHFLHYVLNDDEATDIAYGGARGGNKTATGAIAMILRRLQIPHSKGIAFRKTESAAVKNLRDEFRKWFRHLGVEVKWNSAGQDPRTFKLYNGSSIELSSVWNEESYTKHIGMQYTDIWWEEAVQHEPTPISMVNGSCRTDVVGCIPKKWYTTNPGGPGHQWIYDEFVNPKTRKPSYRWVRSTLWNALPTLLNDPGYLDRLMRGLAPWKRAQWVEGDWLAMAGQYFDLHPTRLCEFNTPGTPLDGIAASGVTFPYWANFYGAVDYGTQAPFCVLYALKWQDTWGADHIHFIGEVYQRRLHLDEQASAALDMQKVLEKQFNINKDIVYYGDPSIAYPKPSESGDEDFMIKAVWGRRGFHVIPAQKITRVSGWHLMRMLMKDGVMTISPSGCPAFITELRNAVYEKPDSRKYEDIDPKCEDHALTAASYLLRKVFLGGYQATRQDAYTPVKVERKSWRPEDAIV